MLAAWVMILFVVVADYFSDEHTFNAADFLGNYSIDKNFEALYVVVMTVSHTTYSVVSRFQFTSI
jgi:hypothetical protein